MQSIECPIHGLCEGLVILVGTVCAKCFEELTGEELNEVFDGSEDF